MRILLILLFTLSPCYANLIDQYKKDFSSDPKGFEVVKQKTLDLKGKAVPTLLQVVKSSDYPDKNRWAAMFLIGRIMGKKSKSFLVKYLEHPNWVLRMASLKTLLSLNAREFGSEYAALLKDSALLVRSQALENIRYFKLRDFGGSVWNMLYDSQNYYHSKSKGKIRAHIIRDVIKTLGDLDFEKVKKPLLKMAFNQSYDDVFAEIDYTLERITGKRSPNGPIEKRRKFWKKIASAN